MILTGVMVSSSLPRPVRACRASTFNRWLRPSLDRSSPAPSPDDRRVSTGSSAGRRGPEAAARHILVPEERRHAVPVDTGAVAALFSSQTGAVHAAAGPAD